MYNTTKKQQKKKQKRTKKKHVMASMRRQVNIYQKRLLIYIIPGL